jgi:hypothetical protein
VERVTRGLYARQLVVRGTIGRRNWGKNLGTFAEVRPSEGWVGQGPNAPDQLSRTPDIFVKVEDTGVRCFTHPCPSFRDRRLNSRQQGVLAELDWDSSGAVDGQVGEALDRMHIDGLIVAGTLYEVTGPGGKGRGRKVTSFYLRATDDAGGCHVSGCSSHVCSDRADVITTCEWRPEYACYGEATCERQADGACGWTETDELRACLADPPQD